MIANKPARIMYRLTNILERRALYSTNRKLSNGPAGKSAKAEEKKGGKYKNTILLPETQFPARIGAAKRTEMDKYLNKKCRFSELYEWQRKNLKEPDFVLHDGPPYANGVPHMGHAINKILKDITLRNKIIRGRRVHYIPGWDCHGLPIEMKVIDQLKTNDPLEIRSKARKYAERAIADQKQAFEAWGVTANWNESGCYFTNSIPYIQNQLMQFINLYEKGLIYRDFKPVYWSPSSRTALAESELEYNEQHKSKSAFVRLRMQNLPDKLQTFKNRNVYAITWTTTPWTLVANQALAFSENAVYCLAEDSDNNLNIIAKDLLGSVESKIGALQSVTELMGNELSTSTYLHPVTGITLPFLSASHVTPSVGTGLVHTAPAHGPEDFLVALKHNLKALTMVDEEGRYTKEAGIKFCGLKVLTEGTDAVIQHMAQNVLLVEEITHSYPYDWRTKKPVIIRASDQWFINIECIKQQAVDSISDIQIYPEVNRSSSLNALLAQVKRRPYWCISRQRAWGTPIPVLFCKSTGNVLTNRKLIEQLCHSINVYGPDCWWEYPIEKIIGLDVINDFGVKYDDVVKGQDIMDIWFDSGTSWSAVLPNRKADLYLEGLDQFTGWFQSSLLTSIALQGSPPYRELFVHGFAVDDKALKMSKSVGNVISPDEIIKGSSKSLKVPAYGVDVLRWWVARHGCQHSQIPVTKELLDGCQQSLHRLRLVLRFLLGVLHPYCLGINVEPQYQTIDKYMLYLLYQYNKEIQLCYDNYQYHHVCKMVDNFVANEVSGFYCHLTKDRLYCEEATSPIRIAAVEVSRELLTILSRTIAPIVPHLAEEVWLHYPDNIESVPLHFSEYQIPDLWNDSSVVKYMNAALRLKTALNNLSKENTWKFEGIVYTTPEDFVLLSSLQKERKSSVSELCEILQLSSITLIEDETLIKEPRIELKKIETPLCERCRRHLQTEDKLCARCEKLISKSNL